LYTAAYFELDERHMIKYEKVALDRFRVRQNVFLVSIIMLAMFSSSFSCSDTWVSLHTSL